MQRVAFAVEVGVRRQPGADPAEIELVDIGDELPLPLGIDLADRVARLDHLPRLNGESGQPPATGVRSRQAARSGGDHRQALAQISRAVAAIPRDWSASVPFALDWPLASAAGDAALQIGDFLAERIDRGGGDEALFEQRLLLAQHGLRLGKRVARIGKVARRILPGALYRQFGTTYWRLSWPTIPAERLATSSSRLGLDRRASGVPAATIVPSLAISSATEPPCCAVTKTVRRGATSARIGTKSRNASRVTVPVRIACASTARLLPPGISHHRSTRRGEHCHADRDAHDQLAPFAPRTLDPPVMPAPLIVEEEYVSIMRTVARTLSSIQNHWSDTRFYKVLAGLRKGLAATVRFRTGLCPCQPNHRISWSWTTTPTSPAPRNLLLERQGMTVAHAPVPAAAWVRLAERRPMSSCST